MEVPALIWEKAILIVSKGIQRKWQPSLSVAGKSWPSPIPPHADIQSNKWEEHFYCLEATCLRRHHSNALCASFKWVLQFCFLTVKIRGLNGYSTPAKHLFSYQVQCWHNNTVKTCVYVTYQYTHRLKEDLSGNYTWQPLNNICHSVSI